MSLTDRWNRWIKRLRWRFRSEGTDKESLLLSLKKPDPDLADLIWSAYLQEAQDLREIMAIVYDDGKEFPRSVRLAAGKTALNVIRDFFGTLYLSGVSWTNPERGRVAYLIGIAIYLPELKSRAAAIAAVHFNWNERIQFDEAVGW
jgi:hypothetical protein